MFSLKMPGKEIRGRTAERDPNQGQEDQSNNNEKHFKNIKGKAGGKQKNHVGVIIAEFGVLSFFVFFPGGCRHSE